MKTEIDDEAEKMRKNTKRIPLTLAVFKHAPSQGRITNINAAITVSSCITKLLTQLHLTLYI